MRLIVTRTEPGASDTLARLAALGHEGLSAPALRVELLPGAPPLEGAQALLFTSSNGARAFADNAPRRDLPALCVGEATAAVARDSGFADVRSADGDLDALAGLAATLDPRAGRLVHIAGADLAGDLAALLRDKGFEVLVHTAYRARAATLPVAAAAALADGSVDGVLFHSARGAAAFLAQTDPAPLARLDAFCLSAAVADAVKPVRWRNVLVARAPNDTALLALLPHGDFGADSGAKS